MKKVGSVFVLSSCLIGHMHADHSVCNDFDVYTSLIVWTASEAGDGTWAEVIVRDSAFSKNDILGVEFGWDPGFRVGIGYEFCHDTWDVQAIYTRFNTKGKDSASDGPGTVHSAFLGNFYVDNPTGANLSGPPYQKGRIRWTIDFNIFDFELGRQFCLSTGLFVRPFIGVKGGWIDQSIRTEWINPTLTVGEFFEKGTENLKHDFWGVGPSLGVNTQWNLYHGRGLFYLFGDFSGAFMWGHWSFSDVFKNDLPQEVIVDLESLNSGASMVRTFMGFGWDMCLTSRSFLFSLKLGFESQFWLDQLQFYSFTGGRLDNELTLQGGTFELSLSF